MDDSSVSSHHKIFAWANQQLAKLQPNITPEYQIIQENPWSSVIKIITPINSFYLKQTPPDLFIETAVIQILENICQVKNIPQVIASNKEHHCFIMTDCGDITLRTFSQGKLQQNILIEAIKTYKQFQKSTEKHIDDFIKIGVPDWRLKQFPIIYMELLNNTEFLESENISEDLRKQLVKLEPILKNCCEELATYNIPECLNHSDLHDNNIIIKLNNHKCAIVDLGETAINHPFFSLDAWLRATASRYHLQREDDDYLILKAALFDGYYDSENDLQKVESLINKLLPIYLTFAHMRLVVSTPANSLSSITRMNDRIKEGFEWFVKVAATYNQG